ncbi:hypothetical protein H2198_000088 [Neophaeococcomyces mojaviensis]|uniref:Uncharacterized protein n=1 Tax=Neophaeococcomyces mojaviensis TaxID=3383035 RepID=A0ACC3AL88_9EURO|nr:hypothetical protein H2198_000088 [Knufia sp. JES_112]
MSKFAVPAAGIQLQHDEPDSKDPPQILRLNLAENITKDLLNAVRSNGQARIKLGKRPAITFGTRTVSLNHGTDKFPAEIFRGPLDGSGPVYFSGKLSHTLEVQQAKEATAGVDQALATLKQNLKASQEDRAAGGTGLISNKLLGHQHRPSPLSSGFLTSRPSSPFLSGLSPRVGPTSAPLQTGPTSKEKIRLDAIRIPLIHLLAIEPWSPDALAQKVRVKRSDCDKVLEKVARDVKGGKKELKDKIYKDLDVWKFSYQSQQDRQAAIDHAVSAYDRMRIEKTDQLWQMLLAKEDRNKGTYLSRLNFDKPLAAGNLTPKINERSTDGSIEGKSMASDQSSKKGKGPATKLTDDLPKTKSSAETKVKTAALKDKVKTLAVTEGANKLKATKQDTKFKSSERIEDSDEEADAGRPVIASKHPIKRKEPVVEKPVRSEKASSASSKPPLHKPHLSGSSGGGTDVDHGRLTPSSAMARTRGGADTSKAQAGNASRPRNGSSPVKPSPLGSSPPTNSRDVDSTSNSSKGTSQSSAPSSPPSSTELSNTKTKNYSPVAAERKLEKHSNGPNKRKAESSADQPPSKRQHINSSGNKDRVNGDAPKVPKRDSPDSDTISTSEKSAITKQHVENEARQFKKYWDRYKDLHDRLEKQPDSQRDSTDIEKLWKMHLRLKEMKEQIWRDWDKLEKLEPK